MKTWWVLFAIEDICDSFKASEEEVLIWLFLVVGAALLEDAEDVIAHAFGAAFDLRDGHAIAEADGGFEPGDISSIEDQFEDVLAIKPSLPDFSQVVAADDGKGFFELIELREVVKKNAPLTSWSLTKQSKRKSEHGKLTRLTKRCDMKSEACCWKNFLRKTSSDYSMRKLVLASSRRNSTSSSISPPLMNRSGMSFSNKLFRKKKAIASLLKHSKNNVIGTSV